tara:strand:- start:255 stop:503 length:249 start_codon:yes stop_codon:yes gene_type:complete
LIKLIACQGPHTSLLHVDSAGGVQKNLTKSGLPMSEIRRRGLSDPASVVMEKSGHFLHVATGGVMGIAAHWIGELDDPRPRY